MPERTKLLARSVAPVKSSAMQPNFMVKAFDVCLLGVRVLFGFGQLNARENFDHRTVILFGKTGGARLHEHLMRGA